MAFIVLGDYNYIILLKANSKGNIDQCS